ncbi:SLATT domain-containing protein [Pseudomonas sp. 8O]|uniref:SLATT domain-containing protein n=1 Tax=Pseudomonas sp. 8O TaxID=2653165 RepID=UPI00135A7E27|nr:SLATT domain-containing protein [Pseudomonas sp. 8O]
MDKLAAYKKLLASASCTADYRFNAYRRLLRLEHASNLALISASTALIVVSVIVALYSNELGQYEKIITIGQNCMPVIMLAVSIMVSGAKYGIRAEKMHECAQTLNHLKKLFNFKIQNENFDPKFDEFNKDSLRYARTISKYDNHADADVYVEKVRSWFEGKCISWLAVIPIEIIEKGWIYYCYATVSILSLAWIFLGLYSVTKGI